jgi:ABC-type glycerol-3-phosphate transport system substrate-binding protein
MKLPVRMALPLAALALATACAPGTSDNGSAGDDKSGTLRVWLFQEVNNQPKQKIVDAAVAAFEKSHKGADVKVEYIPVETRAEKIKAAFNDPKSAPDVIEYGNTDTAGYVKDGGLADVTEEFGAWPEAKDTDPPAEESLPTAGIQPVVQVPHDASHHVPGGADGARRGPHHSALLPHAGFRAAQHAGLTDPAAPGVLAAVRRVDAPGLCEGRP